MANRTKRLQFGQNLLVVVKHRNDSTIVNFVFKQANRSCHLLIKILKNDAIFFIDRFLNDGGLHYWDVKGYAIDAAAGRTYVTIFEDPQRDMTPEKRRDFKIKWQEALNEMVNEDTYTFQIPTFLCEVLSLESELFEKDLDDLIQIDSE